MSIPTPITIPEPPNTDLPYNGHTLFDDLDTALIYFSTHEGISFLVAMESTNLDHPGWYQNSIDFPMDFYPLESGKPTKFQKGIPPELDIPEEQAKQKLPLKFLGYRTPKTERATPTLPKYSWADYDTRTYSWEQVVSDVENSNFYYDHLMAKAGLSKEPDVFFQTYGGVLQFDFPSDKRGDRFFFKTEKVKKEDEKEIERLYTILPVFSCSKIYTGIKDLRKNLFNPANRRNINLEEFKQLLIQEFIKEMPVAFSIINELLLTGYMTIRGQKNVMYISSKDETSGRILKLSVEDTAYNNRSGIKEDSVIEIPSKYIESANDECKQLKAMGKQKAASQYNHMQYAKMPPKHQKEETAAAAAAAKAKYLKYKTKYLQLKNTL